MLSSQSLASSPPFASHSSSSCFPVSSPPLDYTAMAQTLHSLQANPTINTTLSQTTHNDNHNATMSTMTDDFHATLTTFNNRQQRWNSTAAAIKPEVQSNGKQQQRQQYAQQTVHQIPQPLQFQGAAYQQRHSDTSMQQHQHQAFWPVNPSINNNALSSAAQQQQQVHTHTHTHTHTAALPLQIQQLPAHRLPIAQSANTLPSTLPQSQSIRLFNPIEPGLVNNNPWLPVNAASLLAPPTVSAALNHPLLHPASLAVNQELLSAAKKRLARKAALARVSRRRKKDYVASLEHRVQVLIALVSKLAAANRKGEVYELTADDIKATQAEVSYKDRRCGARLCRPEEEADTSGEDSLNHINTMKRQTQADLSSQPTLSSHIQRQESLLSVNYSAINTTNPPSQEHSVVAISPRRYSQSHSITTDDTPLTHNSSKLQLRATQH